MTVWKAKSGWLGAFGATFLFVGCGSHEEELQVPDQYEFESRFDAGASSVSYSGQTMRHVLIHDLNATIAGLGGRIDGAKFQPDADGQVVAILNSYFRFDSVSRGSEPILLETMPPALQQAYDDISGDKDLVGKIAGNDDVTDHQDWTSAFSGWEDTSVAAHGGTVENPEGLVVAWFEMLEERALARVSQGPAKGPGGNPLPVYVTERGLDLKQLIQKFLLGAVAFSQGADDYLDDDVSGKGLLADNTQPADPGAAYTALEHAWDEGFGYFGASREYGEYTDEEIAGRGGRPDWEEGYHDADEDGFIDLTAEYNFGNSTNAAKRDLGSSSAARTDFTAQAFTGFVRGRAIIAAASGALTDEELTALQQERDLALQAWEQAIAATVVHYINDTLLVMGHFGTADYDFAEHAKVWSEMKGFALGFQFNPRSPMNEAQRFATFHDLVGDAPVLEGDGATAVSQYETDLIAARTLVGEAYGFASENMGDAQGEGGW